MSNTNTIEFSPNTEVNTMNNLVLMNKDNDSLNDARFFEVVNGEIVGTYGCGGCTKGK